MTEQDPPAPPGRLPKYLAEDLPKQDSETLSETQAYIEELVSVARELLSAVLA